MKKTTISSANGEAKQDVTYELFEKLQLKETTDIKRLIATAQSEQKLGRFETAASIFHRVLELDADNVVAHRALARIATIDSRPRDAIARWLEVKRLRPDIRETPLRLGRLYKQTKQYTDALKAFEEYRLFEPGHVETEKAIAYLRDLSKNQSDFDDYCDFRHIAIAGVSYCGSTLFARILGSLDGVENIGESHWLTVKKDNGKGEQLDFLTSDGSDIVDCFSCGSSCKVLTRDFRQLLQKDPANWYLKIGQQLGSRILVSADKNHPKLVKLDPGLRMDTVVLFKSPLQAWYSNYKKIEKAGASLKPVVDVHKYVKVWVNSYSKFLDHFENRGDKVFLNFESFCCEPDTHLQTLCNILHLPIKSNALQVTPSGQHCLGGNQGVNSNHRDKDYKFEIRFPPEVDLPPEHIDLIEQDDNAQMLYHRMMDNYRRDFGFIDASTSECRLACSEPS